MQFQRFVVTTCCLLLILALPACSPGPITTPAVYDRLPPTLAADTASAAVTPDASLQAVVNFTATAPNSLSSATATSATPVLTVETPTLAAADQSAAIHPAAAGQIELLTNLNTNPFGSIQEVFWQPGSQNLLVQSSRQLFLLDFQKGEVIWSLPAGYSELLFTPDGRELIAVQGSEIQFIDPASGKVLSTREFPNIDGLYALSPDGQSIASTLGGDITLLNLQSGETRSLPTDLSSGPVFDLAFSPDGQWIIAGSQNGDLQAWDAASGRRTRFLPAAIPSPVYDCQVSGARDHQPTGALVIACSYPSKSYQAATYQAGIFSASAGAPGSTLVIQDTGLRGYHTFRVNADRSRVAVMVEEQVEVWSASGSSRLKVLKTDAEGGMAFHPQAANQLAVWSPYALSLWDIKSGQKTGEWLVPGVAAPATLLAFSPAPGRRLLVVARQNGLLEHWDVAAMQKMAEWQGEAITTLAFSADGASLAVGEQSGRVSLFQMAAAGFVPEKEIQAGFAVNALTFDPNTLTRLYVAGQSHHVHLWDVQEMTETGILEGSNLFELVTLDARSNILAAGTGTGRIVFWQTAPGAQPFAELSFAEMTPILSLQLGADSRQVIFSQRNVLKVWDIQTKQRVRETTFRNAKMLTARLAPDGCSLAAQTPDWLALFGSDSLEAYRQFDTFGQVSGALAFSSDGLILAGGDQEGGLLLWGVAGALQSPNGPTPAPGCNAIPLPTATPTATLTPRPSPTLSPTVTATPTPTPPVFVRTLSLTQPNLQGEDVLLLQMRLVELGYSIVGIPDGSFGPKTDQAVRLFQERNNLVVDGIVGPITWQRLFSQAAARP